MATLKPAVQPNIVDLSDDEGCHLAAGNQHLDNSRVSAMYLRNHGDEIHEALDVRVNPTTYSEARRQFEVLKTPNAEAALEWYRKENNDMRFDVLNCSWDDLFEQMARAQGDHKDRVAHKGNWFRYLWRKAGTQKDAIEPWLQLIPDEYGLSLLRGAIAIVFHIAEKSHEKEKSLLDGFEMITETIHNAMSKNISFQRDPEMHACCQALYDTLVGGIADLIWSLKPEVKGKNFIEKFKNKQEKEKSINIKEILKKVQKKSTELDQCAERILARKAIETHEGVGIVQIELSAQQSTLVGIETNQSTLLTMTHESSNEVKSVNRNLLQLGYAAQKFDEKTEAFHNRLLEKLDFMNKDREQTVSAAKSQNAALVLLSEYFKKDLFGQIQTYFMEERNQLSLEIRRSLTPVPQSVYELVMEPEDLLDILMVPLSLANADMMTCARHKTGFSDQVLQQAQSLVSTEKFNYWLQSERSETLLVDGNDEQNMRGMITPMSVLTATLSSALEGAYGKEGFIPLQFWCSMHTRRRDDVQGPLGMMRALLVQLVAALLNRNINQKFNFGDVNEKEFLGDLEEGCFRALKQTLKMLLELVPCELPVFFFIDDVSSFEDQRFCEDLHDVVGMLDCFVEENRNKIKVLYTCPYRNMTLVRRGFVSPRDYVLLEDGGREGYGQLTEQSIRNQISRNQSGW